ncbi:MAG: hypothetical protein VXV97_01345 [Pseudomonadota bacterium]|nr:hypothetical protein [Pseudomonadota bacterium]MEC7301201.1 hypothetical protein [Pseudomonadota bacterium]MED5359569.1 hypothetical protein [Pseudomonadota bacterium]
MGLLEIIQKVAKAAGGTQEVASNIIEISQTADGPRSKATKMLDAANEMNR